MRERDERPQDRKGKEARRMREGCGSESGNRCEAVILDPPPPSLPPATYGFHCYVCTYILMNSFHR